MLEHPLARAERVADVESFEFPDPHAKGRFRLAKEVAERYGESHAICGDAECTVFEGSWYLTGFEKFLVDLSLEKDYVFALMDRMMRFSIEIGRQLVAIGADIIWLGDDVGTQNGMLLSPDLWRKHLKDRLSTVIRSLKDGNPRVMIAYHCCGSYAPIIPELVEIGVDILNALQPTARDMDLPRLKRLYGERVAFFGGMDIQSVIPFGTVQDVEGEVRRVIDAAGKGGGLILAGAHNFQPDVSVEKIVSVFETCRQYGKYPVLSST
jgi:uroporphyrinogen decarboxylase